MVQLRYVILLSIFIRFINTIINFSKVRARDLSHNYDGAFILKHKFLINERQMLRPCGFILGVGHQGPISRACMEH